ncbi:unnamed protein product [Effrenium voratum]|uniref:Uncharacterized protein n=1 Tax=Effrenium voratum TaxID=2562239 RepID=A0AA36IZK7_9DINO|nr:unnamed protein product [Effrenium voratum]
MVIRAESQMADLDSRLSMALSELEVRQQAERTERGADLVAVRSDLDRQWEELSKGLSGAVGDMESRAQKEKQEVLDALAAVCSDIESLRKRQKEFEGEKMVDCVKELQEPLQQALSALRSDLARISGEVLEGQRQQACLRGAVEQTLRNELQRFVMEELQVRRLNELESLQSEDSRHRGDIEALRGQQNAALEALRGEQSALRSAQEAQVQVELQAVRKQLSNCMEALSSVPSQPLPSSSDDGDELRDGFLELQEECGRLGERLGEDVAELRAQLAEGLAEVRTAQARQGGDLQILRSTWDSRWKEIKESQETHEAEEEPKSSLAVVEGGLRQEDLQALLQRHEGHAAEVQSRLGMQSREIQEMQRQLLDVLRDLSAVRRLSLEVEDLRQDRRELVNMIEDERKRDAGEWSIFKAFGGCKAPSETAPSRVEDPVQRHPPPVTVEDLELLRSKQRQEGLELRSQQRSFFDEVLQQQAANQQQVSSDLEAVRSHCNAAIAGFHSHQTSALEVLQKQQRRMQQIQGQLMGDVGSMKSQLVESLRAQRVALAAPMARTEVAEVTV